METKLQLRNEPVTKTVRHACTLRRILHGQSGQSLVELALITPILLLLVIGTVEMGRYATLSILLGNAARAGADFGAQNPTTAGDQAGISNAALADLKDISSFTTQPTVNSEFICGCDNGGAIIPTPETHNACATTCSVSSHLVTSVHVTVTGIFSSMFSYPGIPSPLTITGTATERVAN